MVSLIAARHQPKHARTPRAAHEAPQPVPLPEKYRPLKAWLERRARGEWVNPEVEDWMRSLQRDYRTWWHKQQRD